MEFSKNQKKRRSMITLQGIVGWELETMISTYGEAKIWAGIDMVEEYL